MNSLYHALLIQHPKQLTPVRCAEQTIVQMHRYFEDVVLENSLSALVIESLPRVAERQLREIARVRELGRAAQNSFIFVDPRDALNRIPLKIGHQDKELRLLLTSGHEELEERFVVIADARFSALLASYKSAGAGSAAGTDEVIWTFEPDVVYTALEYLMARVMAERPLQANDFVAAVRSSMPKATSLQLTVSVTTKLARMLQEQAGREIAINRIATAIRNSLDLDDILQTTVNEVGQALGSVHCALSVTGEAAGAKFIKIHFRDQEKDEGRAGEIVADLDAYSKRLATHLQNHVLDGRIGAGDGNTTDVLPLAVVPLIYHARFMGALLVRSDDPGRTWQENELLLLRTVADQVIVAVSHARLFAQTQRQALTDELTGCFNRRSLELQLERDMRSARREDQSMSLIICDLDHFKRINDSFGHDAGDVVLRVIGEKLRAELRGRDTAARFGGEEFAIILPEADLAGAKVVAERLREQLSTMDIPGVGTITASFGLATFPLHGNSRDELVIAADRALYEAKNAGRNQVKWPNSTGETVPGETPEPVIEPVDEPPVKEPPAQLPPDEEPPDRRPPVQEPPADEPTDRAPDTRQEESDPSLQTSTDDAVHQTGPRAGAVPKPKKRTDRNSTKQTPNVVLTAAGEGDLV